MSNFFIIHLSIYVDSKNQDKNAGSFCGLHAAQVRMDGVMKKAIWRDNSELWYIVTSIFFFLLCFWSLNCFLLNDEGAPADLNVF